MKRILLLIGFWVVSSCVSVPLVRANQLPDETIVAPISGGSSRATSNSNGTTVNQQTNVQTNNNQHHGFGVGIHCPTPTLGVGLYGSGGQGGSGGGEASVSSSALGGIITFTAPLGGRSHEICRALGEAQLELTRSQAARAANEAEKVNADINFVTIQQCIAVLQVAQLSGPFAELCAGVNLTSQGGMDGPIERLVSTPPPPQVTAAPPPPQTAVALPPDPLMDPWDRLHVAVLTWDMETALLSLTRLIQSPNACISRFASQLTIFLRERGVGGFRTVNSVKRALNQEGCQLPIQPYEFSP
jgi:hypothetical protein